MLEQKDAADSIHVMIKEAGDHEKRNCQEHRKPLFQYRGTGIVVFYALEKVRITEEQLIMMLLSSLLPSFVKVYRGQALRNNI